MTDLLRRRAMQAASALVLGGCTALPVPDDGATAAAETPPDLPREWRAAWVATVGNIDWPRRPGLPVAEQRAEMRRLLDAARALNLNALLLQVRPSADALYPSALEPWTEYLTGTQGQDPGWDPLAEWVDGAHARGMELHAWVNPYRARASVARSAAAPTHLSMRRPDLVRAYGDQQWIDPGEDAAAEHTLAVCADLLRRYEVDGLHIDDYFYPYPVRDGERALDFPDQSPWQRYQSGGGTLGRADWRRQRVNRLVAALQAQALAVRPAARFSISPFGIGRPDLRAPGVRGFSQYDALYADVEHWLAQGWCDMLLPQLYWPIASDGQAFPALLDHWLSHNPKGRAIWPGLFTSRLPAEGEPPPGWSAAEIAAQVALTRARGAGGHAHFSLRALAGNHRGVARLLRDGAYAEAALPPPAPRPGTLPPAPPVLQGHADATGLHLLCAGDAGTRQFAVWLLETAPGGGARWRFHLQPASTPAFTWVPSPGMQVRHVWAQAVDAAAQASAATGWAAPEAG